ncbi:MAG: AmmeMemoRadiSam system radical SAM enzyme [Candidatus Omnitrophica bacterium]|nr:AmmeMemoRadiSam system radical SAM enzyme [Candidatus Omnitrophota bacterium]
MRNSPYGFAAVRREIHGHSVIAGFSKPKRRHAMKSRLYAYIFFLCFPAIVAFSTLAVEPSKSAPHEASFYHRLENGSVQCVLCPRRCTISEGSRGFCGVRENRKGRLYSLVYGQPCSLHIDPIEKKPLFHFFPGSNAFSLATVGCNLKCKFCQNWQISQASPEDVAAVALTPEEVVEKVKASGARVIAYTYTEPTIYYEYMFEIARLARTAGIKNVMHSAGYINEEPLRQLCPYLDAANIDLKGFNDRFYSEMTLGGLEDVLRTLKILREQGVWLEITHLLIPGVNDDPEETRKMCLWIRDNLGARTPLHLSRFWPMHKLVHLSPTPVSHLQQARQIALDAGLKYVYIGNVGGVEGEDTFCPQCKAKVVDRAGYVVTALHVIEGRCAFCGADIDGVWERE